MGFLDNLLGFEFDHGKQLLDKVIENPGRVLIGSVDPFSTKMWNGILGTNDKPMVNQWGGATEEDYADAEARGIGTKEGRLGQGVAQAVAQAFALNYASGIGSGGAGGGAGGAGAGLGGAEAAPGVAGSVGAGAGIGANGIVGNVGKYVAAGLPIVSSALQAQAAKNALNQQRQGADQSDATQRYFYDTNRADQMPFLLTGYGANDQINKLMATGGLDEPTFSGYQKDPSYDFQQAEAAKAIEGSMASRGGLYRGSTQRALGDRAQSIANAGYADWYNRKQGSATNKINQLNAIRSGGQVSAGAIGSAGINAANVISGNRSSIGDSAGASAIAQGNIRGNALNRLSSYAASSYNGGSRPDQYNMFDDGNDQVEWT